LKVGRHGWGGFGDIKLGIGWGWGDGRQGWGGYRNLGMEDGWKWGQNVLPCHPPL